MSADLCLANGIPQLGGGGGGEVIQSSQQRASIVSKCDLVQQL